jgi:hypothetical protein
VPHLPSITFHSAYQNRSSQKQTYFASSTAYNSGKQTRLSNPISHDQVSFTGGDDKLKDELKSKITLFINAGYPFNTALRGKSKNHINQEKLQKNSLFQKMASTTQSILQKEPDRSSLFRELVDFCDTQFEDYCERHPSKVQPPTKKYEGLLAVDGSYDEAKATAAIARLAAKHEARFRLSDVITYLVYVQPDEKVE